MRCAVEVRDLVAVAVEDDGRDGRGRAGARHQLRLLRLAPPGVVEGRVDVGPEAVLGRRDGRPPVERLRRRKRDAADALDALEPVLVRQRQAHRGAVLRRERGAELARDEEGQVVPGLVDGQALHVGPGRVGVAVGEGRLRPAGISGLTCSSGCRHSAEALGIGV